MKKEQSKERKWKKTFVYFRGRKRYEEELTYDMFIEGLKGPMEYQFLYNDTTIDISFSIIDGEKIYELTIDGYTDQVSRFFFHSVDDLVEAKKFEGKSIREIWDDLETPWLSPGR